MSEWPSTLRVDFIQFQPIVRCVVAEWIRLESGHQTEKGDWTLDRKHVKVSASAEPLDCLVNDLT